MKKLICAKDVEELISKGEKIFYIDGTEIITPSARDLVKNNGIEFTTKPCEIKVQSLENNKALNMDEFDSEMMINFFKKMMDKGILEEILKCLKQKSLPFEAECDPSGLKVIRGNTVKMDVFDTGNPDAKVYFQELFSKKGSKIGAGFLTIEDSKFHLKLNCEEMNYVIEGTLTVEINGKTYTAHAGDVLFLPKDSTVLLKSFAKTKVFYVKYPESL
ncbi:DUF861 domain-containing protein [Clostridium tetani]|nr:cupin domain-containing protein [Clostridium tetani]KGI38051.1 ethanolamine utilization protein EutQ [Clostridium tetani]KGI43142.1 ethanolamine utilization protein EutQ [Clostridium tetani]KHO32142.1 ethanolamine utilization protein EutQ [Clostridium tetani]KIG19984.1 ethanolamine utilization protein EutQ [Clostridium tetani]QBD85005.1 cupin domain-containing protein [Clostridium tetani]